MTGDITFNTIPTPLYVPGVYVEFAENTSEDSIAVVPPKILLVGQALGGGFAALAGVSTRVYSPDQVGQLCGRGSMLHQMAKKSFAAAPFVPTYIVPEGDVSGGSQSVRHLTITGTATAAGEIDVYIGDTRYPVPVAVGATGAQMATAIAAAIEADTDRYAEAAVDGSITTQVNITARHKGVAAGTIPVAQSRYDNEFIPAGLSMTVGAITAGTSEPDFTAAIAALGDDWYPFIVMPYADNTNLTAWKTELLSRWSGTRMIEGFAFQGVSDTVGNEVAYAATRNDFLLDAIDCFDLLTPPYAFAAGVTGLVAQRPNPAQPVMRMVVPGALAKARTNGYRKFTDRQTLLAGGISTVLIATDGTVMVERLTTTYRTNPQFGTPDNNYFDQERLTIEANMRFSIRVRFLTKYPANLLGANGSVGDLVVTPSTAIGEYVSLYNGWVQNSWAQGGDKQTAFINSIKAQINSTDPTRLDSLLQPATMPKFAVAAIQIQPTQ